MKHRLHPTAAIFSWIREASHTFEQFCASGGEIQGRELCDPFSWPLLACCVSACVCESRGRGDGVDGFPWSLFFLPLVHSSRWSNFSPFVILIDIFAQSTAIKSGLYAHQWCFVYWCYLWKSSKHGVVFHFNLVRACQ